MLRLPMILVATLSGFAVSAPAQIQIHGQLGRHVSVTARIGDRHPAPVVRHNPRARDRDYGRDRDDRFRRGFYRDVCEQVWVEGFYREDYVPPVYGWVVDHCGRQVWAMVQPGHTCRVFVPGHFETRTRRVWVGC